MRSFLFAGVVERIFVAAVASALLWALFFWAIG